MNERTHRIIGTVLLALVLSASTGSIHAQQTRGVAQPTHGVAQSARSADEALLSEVRLIRETLQRAQISAQRERIVVERIRTHSERVERLGRQIAEVRDEIGGIEVHVGQIDERDASLEVQIQQAHDSAQRRALEAEWREMRFTQEAQTQRLDRLRERESAIAAELQREERTLRGLEARLEALDRELEAEARKRSGSTRVVGR